LWFCVKLCRRFGFGANASYTRPAWRSSDCLMRARSAAVHSW